MNLYPVKVTNADRSIVRNCRLVREGGRTRVWHWPVDADCPEVLLESDVDPTRVGATSSYEVGGMRIDPQRGCGCGHRMHGWVPPAVIEG